MAAVPCEDTREVTHPAPLRKNPPGSPGATIKPFTRHPKALARVHRFELQACAVRVLALLLTTGDKDGVSWVSPREMTRLIPRSGRVPWYSLPQVRRALRQLRDKGLIEWQRVAPLRSYPARIDGQTVPGKGLFTTSGGRVWKVHVERVCAQEFSKGKRAGTPVAGWIIGDPPPPIIHDPPSDLSSPSEKLKSDPAPPPESRAGAAAPPRLPVDGRSLRSRTDPGAPPPRHPPAAASTPKVASETPRMADAPRADAPPPGSHPEARERQGGNGHGLPDDRGEPEAPATLEQVRAAIGWLFDPAAGRNRPPSARLPAGRPRP